MHMNDGFIANIRFHGGMYAVSYTAPVICFVHIATKGKWGTIISNSMTMISSFMIIDGTLRGLKLTLHNF